MNNPTSQPEPSNNSISPKEIIAEKYNKVTKIFLSETYQFQF